MKFTETDIKQFEQRGITSEQVTTQLNILQKGIPYVELRDIASSKNGIVSIDVSEQQKYVSLFESKKNSLDLLKFTPASGAATRMFKFLFEFLNEFDPEKESINAYINRKNDKDLLLFFVGLDNFPFYKKVKKRLKKRYNKEDKSDINFNRQRFVSTMLNIDELNFGKKPKGLFPFHSYKHHVSTAFEEHLFEACAYSNENKQARLHFTITKNHKKYFDKQFEKRKEYIESKTGISFNITYSYQSEATDTISLDSNKKILRNNSSEIIFRPGGHGALINNLNDQKADLIFIKNIDNVVVFKYREDVAFYKKMLAGKLLELQELSFDYQKEIDNNKDLDETKIIEITSFLQNELSIKIARDFKKYSKSYKITYLKNILDRPIRVCAMVPNESEPGGGPFWVRHENGKESLQIIESVQINPKNKQQQLILKKATHFNPVDIVCGVKNYKGKKYDLSKFIDEDAGFITSKSYEGKKIKALEHPGLWNGGMAHWNTVFIEVPLITFNPVKTVNDLLKPAHQVK